MSDRNQRQPGGGPQLSRRARDGATHLSDVVDGELLRWMALRGTTVQRTYAAGHPLTPADVLRYLTHDPSPEVQTALALNKAAPGDVLAELAVAGGDYAVHWGLARNPSTPPDVLARLATVYADEEGSGARDRGVSRSLALNPGTPPELLSRFCAAADADVRAAAVLNPWTPERAKRARVADPDPWVRHQLARGLSTPRDVLLALCADPVAVVADSARRHPAIAAADHP